MAVVNELWCLNNPDEAIAWYRKLAAMDNDLSAVYTGLYGEFAIQYTLGRWKQAIETGERLLDKIPYMGGKNVGFKHIAGEMMPTIEGDIGNAQKELDRTGKTMREPGATQAAAPVQPAATETQSHAAGKTQP